MFYPSQEQYVEMAQDYNLIPVYTELFVDMETPISIFKKVCRGQYTYLLESVEGGENLARYSFIGLEPFFRYQCRNGNGVIEDSKGTREVKGDPLNTLKGIMDNYHAPKIDGLPRFYGGAVGYFGYDLIKYVEEIPEDTVNDIDLPDCHFILTRLVLIFDHVKHKVKIVVNTEPGSDAAIVYEEALKWIDSVKKRINQPQADVNRLNREVVNKKYLSNMTKDE